MIPLFCFKSLLNFLNVDLSTTNEILHPKINSWTAHLFRTDNKNCIIFLHHKSHFYFVIFGVKKDDYTKLNELFLEGLITELKKCFSINSFQENLLRSKFKGIQIHPKSNYNIANNYISSLITTLKGIQSLENYGNEVPLEEYYEKHNIFNEDWILKELDNLFN